MEMDYSEELFWKQNNNTLDGLKLYKAYYPNGCHIQECNKKLKDIKLKYAKDDLKETLFVFKHVLKYGGTILTLLIFIFVIIYSIHTKQWPASSAVVPLSIAFKYLSNWEIKE